VSITSPSGGATVSGKSVQVSANASSNAGIAGVQFKLDGGNLGPVITAAPYTTTWDTTQVTNGPHTITAVATDVSANQATSSGVAVLVSNVAMANSVSITTPSSGATVSGNAVTVQANASATAGIASVQFQLDGGNLGSRVTAAPYVITWNTTLVLNGIHTLTAVASDGAGNQLTSAAVQVTVTNAAAPLTISITAPISGVTASGPVTIVATASGSSKVASVQFKVDGINLGSAVTVSPYFILWNTLQASNGVHILTATAQDNAGNSATSAPVTVIVAASSNPTPANLNVPNGGGLSMVTTDTGDFYQLNVLHGRVQEISGSEPTGVAIFGLRSNGVLVTEAGVPASPQISSGRLYAEVQGL